MPFFPHGRAQNTWSFNLTQPILFTLLFSPTNFPLTLCPTNPFFWTHTSFSCVLIEDKRACECVCVLSSFPVDDNFHHDVYFFFMHLAATFWLLGLIEKLIWHQRGLEGLILLCFVILVMPFNWTFDIALKPRSNFMEIFISGSGSVEHKPRGTGYMDVVGEDVDAVLGLHPFFFFFRFCFLLRWQHQADKCRAVKTSFPSLFCFPLWQVNKSLTCQSSSAKHFNTSMDFPISHFPFPLWIWKLVKTFSVAYNFWIHPFSKLYKNFIVTRIIIVEPV